MKVYKQALFYDNKLKIEQAWDLLKVAGQLIHAIEDETGTNIEGVHEIYELTIKADEMLYSIYDKNEHLHHEK